MSFKQKATGPNTIEYKIGEIFSELKIKIESDNLKCKMSYIKIVLILNFVHDPHIIEFYILCQ
jgi:hypothetical protein